MAEPKLILAKDLERYLVSSDLDARKYDRALKLTGVPSKVRQKMQVELAHRKPNHNFLVARQAVYAQSSEDYRYITLFPRRIETAEPNYLKAHFGEWKNYTELTTSTFCNRIIAEMGHCALQFEQQKAKKIARENRQVDEPLARNYADLPETFELFQGIVQLELIK